ncbi:MAG: AMP-binding protein [Pseudomonadota bacterium]|nr:AMP-binding protein [Pseudomonadota bacterium]
MIAPETLWHSLERHAAERPNKSALSDEQGSISYADLPAEIQRRAEHLRAVGCRCVALALPNGREWLLWDLAILKAGLICVPIAPFFTRQQREHLLRSAGVDTVLGMADDSAELLAQGFAATSLGWQRAPMGVGIPAGTAKITFTSGTTGTPKGVCLSAEAMLQVADSLREACSPVDPQQHLILLPLAVLLDNLGAITALLNGASISVPTETGLQGAQINPARLLTVLNQSQPHSLILVPQLLQGLLQAADAGAPLPRSLRFIAVGGGRVAPSLLERAARHGLPVFEGYGLSECASVVCLNRPGYNRPGTVGQPLPHVQIRLADDGEILVRGARALGYLGEPPLTADEWPTGDIGKLEDGYLSILGRKKNQFITAYGRNVNPEWVEAEVAAHPAIAQVLVFGEALPVNVALIVPRSPAFRVTDIEEAIAQANSRLPDYARIGPWLTASEPFTPDNGLLTSNGRLRREQIIEHYRPALLGLLTEDIAL